MTLNIMGEYKDKYGDTAVIHRTRHGIRKLRTVVSPIIEANRVIAPLVAKRIKALRVQRGWTLLEMARHMGWATGNPKERAWAMENNNSRGEGIRLGTLFRLAEVFGVELKDLLPANSEISQAMETSEGTNE